jgi:hypothetical protein
MGSNFHTPYTSSTPWKVANMNNPLSELDIGITYNHNVIVSSAAPITYDKSTGTLAWTGTIYVYFNDSSGEAKYNWIGASSVVVADNEFVYIDLSETDGQETSVATASITTGSASNFIAYNRFILAYRDTTSDDLYQVGLKNIVGSVGVTSTFVGLTDTPVSYSGESLKEVRVNVGETALEFFDPPADFAGMYNGTFSASLVVCRIPMVRAITFPSSLTGSQGVLGTAATAQTDFDILKDAVSFGTMRFAAAGTTASFISAAGATFAAGEVLTVVAPASPDATAADLGFTLKGTR